MTRGLEANRSDNDLAKAVAETVGRRFDASRIAEVEVLMDSDFSFDDLRVVEVRIIFDSDRDEITPREIAVVQDDLYSLLATNGDVRIPLLRIISNADYFGRQL